MAASEGHHDLVLILFYCSGDCVRSAQCARSSALGDHLWVDRTHQAPNTSLVQELNDQRALVPSPLSMDSTLHFPFMPLTLPKGKLHPQGTLIVRVNLPSPYITEKWVSY